MKTRSFVTLGAACLLALTACSGGGDTNAQNTASASSPHQSSSVSRSASATPSTSAKPVMPERTPVVNDDSTMQPSASSSSTPTPSNSAQVWTSPERLRRVRSPPHRLTRTRVILRMCAVQGRVADPLASRATCGAATHSYVWLMAWWIAITLCRS